MHHTLCTKHTTSGDDAASPGNDHIRVWLSNKATLDSYDDLNAPDKSMVWTFRICIYTVRVSSRTKSLGGKVYARHKMFGYSHIC